VTACSVAFRLLEQIAIVVGARGVSEERVD